jgi:hypothetical protein
MPGALTKEKVPFAEHPVLLSREEVLSPRDGF